MITVIDWNFDYWHDVDQTLHCRCGASFRGRAKFRYVGGEPSKVIDRACPSCGDKVEIVRTQSDPETFIISGKS